MGAEFTYTRADATSIACDAMLNKIHVWLQEVESNGAVVYDKATGYKRASLTNCGAHGVEIHSSGGRLEPGMSTDLNIGAHRVHVLATNNKDICLNGKKCRPPWTSRGENRVNAKRYPRKY
ncbi:MAG: hypothetical protein AAB838_00705 [Patescibacteria group bacterium]